LPGNRAAAYGGQAPSVSHPVSGLWSQSNQFGEQESM
jgi:hypothetical protein